MSTAQIEMDLPFGTDHKMRLILGDNQAYIDATMSALIRGEITEQIRQVNLAVTCVLRHVGDGVVDSTGQPLVEGDWLEGKDGLGEPVNSQIWYVPLWGCWVVRENLTLTKPLAAKLKITKRYHELTIESIIKPNG